MIENVTKSLNAIETFAAEGAEKAHKEPSNAKNIDKATNEQLIEKDKEYGGRKGLNPTRYGDWERNGRCVDF